MPTPRGVTWPALARTAIGTLAGLVVGGVLLFSVYGKALDPEGFAAHLAAQDLTVAGVDLTLGIEPLHLAWATLVVEAFLGVLLVLGVRRLWVLLPTLGLAVLFLAVTAHEWYRAAHGLSDPLAGCGCFGKIVTRTPEQAFQQDLALLLVPAVLAFLGRPRGAPRVPRARTLVAAASALAVLGFATQSPDMAWLDDHATQLHPGVRVADLCVGDEATRKCLGGPGGEASPLGEGSHLVVLSHLDGDAFEAHAAAFSAYAEAWYAKAADLAARGGGRPQEPEPWVLTDQEMDGEAWSYEYGAHSEGNLPPAFSIRSLPPALLAPLHRRLPRYALVRDGIVTATWSTFPPLPEIAPGVPDDG